ncbi:MFS transporter [Rhodococcus sp. NPDC058521]|uniref:MFS transporter n=1 Tax=Rhodococcus sp. NPDC058521 TaxID=3346536 RepID=UPI0036571DA6
MGRWFLNVCIATALLQAVYHAVRVLVSYRILNLGGDATSVGIVTALFALTPLLLAVRIGRAVDRHHTATLMRIGVALTAFGTVVIAFSGNLGVVAAGNILLGFGQILVTLTGQSFVSLLSPPGELDRGFAGLTLGVSIGQAVGIPAVGLIVSLSSDASGVHTAPALFVMAAVSALAIPFAFALHDPGPAEHDGPRAAPESVSSMARTPGMKAALLSSLVVLSSMDLVLAYLPVLGSEFGFSVMTVTLLLTARTVATIASRAFLPRLLTRVPRERLLVSATLCSAVPMALIPFVPHPVPIAALLVIAGAFWGIGQPLTMTWVVGLVASTDRGAALSLRLTGNRLGQVVVPLAAAGAAGVAGVASIFVITGGLLCLSAASTWHAVRRPSFRN